MNMGWSPQPPFQILFLGFVKVPENTFSWCCGFETHRNAANCGMVYVFFGNAALDSGSTVDAYCVARGVMKIECCGEGEGGLPCLVADELWWWYLFGAESSLRYDFRPKTDLLAVGDAGKTRNGRLELVRAIE